jgi:hypothetical protein
MARQSEIDGFPSRMAVASTNPKATSILDPSRRQTDPLCDFERRYWGRGYATEATAAAIADGFDRVGLKEIVAMTALGNTASMRVMERLGMTRSIKFDYPNHPEGSPSRRHILYRLQRPAQRQLGLTDVMSTVHPKRP